MLVIPRSRSPPNTFFFVICSNLLLLQQEQQQAAAHHRRQLLLAAAAARGSRRVYITRRTASSPLLSYASTRELTHTTVPDTERGHETVDIQYNVCTEYITLYMISYQTENKKKTFCSHQATPVAYQRQLQQRAAAAGSVITLRKSSFLLYSYASARGLTHTPPSARTTWPKKL